MESSPKSHATKNAYLLARCTSRDFVCALLASRAHVEQFSIKQKLEATLQHLGNNYWRAFTSSFNPQRRLRRQLYKLRSKNAKAKRYFMREFPKKISQLSWKTKRNAWRSKVSLCAELREYRGLGPFSAKNMWQFHRLEGVCSRYPAKYNLAFGEVGPGGRRGVCLMNGWPPKLGNSATDWQSALFFSQEVALIFMSNGSLLNVYTQTN